VEAVLVPDPDTGVSEGGSAIAAAPGAAVLDTVTVRLAAATALGCAGPGMASRQAIRNTSPTRFAQFALMEMSLPGAPAHGLIAQAMRATRKVASPALLSSSWRRSHVLAAVHLTHRGGSLPPVVEGAGVPAFFRSSS
jgi:hypothetical protein